MLVWLAKAKKIEHVPAGKNSGRAREMVNSPSALKTSIDVGAIRNFWDFLIPW
jgi:hypothetical protein